MYRLQTTSGTCEEKVTWRKCIGNREVAVDVITVYNNATATCNLDRKKVQQLTDNIYYIFENQRGKLKVGITDLILNVLKILQVHGQK